MRADTHELHLRLEGRLDAVAQLSDPMRRPVLIRRYAALHVPADAALAPHLVEISDLEFFDRSRAPFLANHVGKAPLPEFPLPASRAEALGMLYVLEGSTLGGHLILRTLAALRVDVAGLAFLDPYGAETGLRWRGFLAVLSRETQDEAGGADDRRIAQACRGAVRAFEHAERVLCEAAA